MLQIKRFSFVEHQQTVYGVNNLKNNQLFNEHLNRLIKAVALEKPDRVPVCHDADNVAALLKGLKLKDFCTDPVYAHKMALEGILELGGGQFDACHQPVNLPQFLGFMWLSDMKLPGRELRDNEIWQLDEKPLMTEEDYDFILDKGWNAFVGMYAKTRLKDDIFEAFQTMMAISPEIIKNIKDAGIVPITEGAAALPPVESFFAARSMTSMMRDLFRFPDKVEAACDVVMEETLETLEEILKSQAPFAVFTGGTRTTPEFLSPKLWERFYFKYQKGIAEKIIEAGSVVYFHMDGRWDLGLEYFREFPKGKCIFACDGLTDIYKVKEILGESMCVMGDVPPSLLALGDPHEVYAYCSKLIREIGPSGFILGPGCVAPANAKPENIKAMLSAAVDK